MSSDKLVQKVSFLNNSLEKRFSTSTSAVLQQPNWMKVLIVNIMFKLPSTSLNSQNMHNEQISIDSIRGI